MTPPRAIARALLPGVPRRPRDPETGQFLAGIRVQAKLTKDRTARGYFTSWADAAQWIATLDEQREVKGLLMTPVNAYGPAEDSAPEAA